MRNKKKSRATAPKKRSAATALAKRVKQLEADMQEVRLKMSDFGDDLSALRTLVKHVDERTLRGERLMNSMQLEQRHTARVVDAIAEKLQVVVPTPVPKVDDVSEDEIPELSDDELEEESKAK